MSSNKEPFSREQRCPVVNLSVTLSGIYVSLAGTAERAIAHRTCSNQARCMEKLGPIENIKGCLLHTL